MTPIKIEFKNEKSNTIQNETIELVELINFLFSNEYKLSVKNDQIFFDIRNNSETWYTVKDYALFKSDFYKKVDKSNKNASYEVKIKNSNLKIEWAFFDTRHLNHKSEFRLLRFISNGNYLVTYYHNGQSNEEIDLLKTDLGQLYEALPILGTTDYKIGTPIEIEILKKLESNKYRFDFSELDRFCEFAKFNNLKFRLINIENN